MGTGALDTSRAGPLRAMAVDLSFVQAESFSSGGTLRAALVGGYLEHFSLLEVTLRGLADCRLTGDNTAPATAVLARVRLPECVILK